MVFPWMTTRKAGKKRLRMTSLAGSRLLTIKAGMLLSIATYGVDMIPSSFLIDRHGVIRTINAEGPDLENSVRDLLKD